MKITVEIDTNNINEIQEDSINQKLREEIEDLKNECVELNAYVKDVEGALDTSSKKETISKIKNFCGVYSSFDESFEAYKKIIIQFEKEEDYYKEQIRELKERKK
jgi:hypothetical protein